ncbi:hypothetical protein CP977_31365 [Streptomyces cinereoruber]|uniref:DUF4034 domain-containing protein n=1 Tax=Streptomyces cinereoruber TaxID=67260 RepID=A0ABX6BQ58_9ACTN|nr:hypothetical protein [Streptomyces cinereoruber]QEV37150.1 hypothetical protein CP977_31365 [Streptomyces cinereoruber]
MEKDSDDPEVLRLKKAAATADWATVREVLEARSEGEGRTELLWTVCDTAGVETWITDVAEAEPGAALPRLLAGLRHVSWGWEARTSARAKDVSREQFEVFHERLRTAERWLYEAAELEPGWASPWYCLQVSGRGLEVGPEVARRRFEATVRRAPHHLGAHQQQLQQVCRKWGGSHEEMHAFARTSALGAPGGTQLGQLVAVAHVEEWLSLDSGPDATYIGRPEVAASLNEAADHSYRHPDFVRRDGWLQVLNSFAMAFSLAGQREAARECFRAGEGRVTEFPWSYLNDSDPVAAYREWRSAAGR